MKQVKADIIDNKTLTRGFYKMRIRSTYLAKNAKPGQFVEVRCSDSNEMILRRPLGVHRILVDGVEILYEIVGQGTEMLSQKEKGDILDVIGPLGNGFKIAKDAHSIIIAGGIGVAPLVSLAENIKSKKDMHVLIGACKKEHILCEKEFKKTGAKVLVATEDGSRGLKGFVTELLKKLHLGGQRTMIYACGPNNMLKAVSKIAYDKNTPCQVSLEERMACGVGVCLGCPVKVRKGFIDTEYKMVCKDGPVFMADEIVW